MLAAEETQRKKRLKYPRQKRDFLCGAGIHIFPLSVLVLCVVHQCHQVQCGNDEGIYAFAQSAPVGELEESGKGDFAYMERSTQQFSDSGVQCRIVHLFFYYDGVCDSCV